MNIRGAITPIALVIFVFSFDQIKADEVEAAKQCSFGELEPGKTKELGTPVWKCKDLKAKAMNMALEKMKAKATEKQTKIGTIVTKEVKGASCTTLIGSNAYECFVAPEIFLRALN